MPTAKNVGEPCAGEPHARIEAAAGGNWHQSALPHGAGASRRPYIELGSRRVHLAGCTANPSGAWVTQHARQLAWGLAERSTSLRFLIRDRDSKFTRDFDIVFRSEGIEVIRTPVRAPKANAVAERFVRTVRAESLDWLLIVNRRHLERVLRVFVEHYNGHRPRRALNLSPPNPGRPLLWLATSSATDRLERRDRLGRADPRIQPCSMKTGFAHPTRVPCPLAGDRLGSNPVAPSESGRADKKRRARVLTPKRPVHGA
jgi:putative transposase